MKYLVFLLFPFLGFAQTDNYTLSMDGANTINLIQEIVLNRYPDSYYEGIVVFDSIQKPLSSKTVCEERGHISKGWTTSTLVYCDPMVYDEKCHSAVWSDFCNTTSYQCARCNEMVSERGSKYFIWQSVDCPHTLKDLN